MDDSLALADSSEQQDERARAEKERIDRLDMLGYRLSRELDDRKAKRRPTEDRWLEDLRQYNGQYDPQVLTEIKANEGSEAFLNITRSKTDAVEARIIDMLSADHLFDIRPTTMPEISQLEMSENVVGQTPQGVDIQARDVAQSVREIAHQRALRMRDTIKDQWEECNLVGELREAVHDGCVLGPIIMKGPVAHSKMRRSFRMVKDASGMTFVANMEKDKRPMAFRVDPWAFYPQSGALRLQDSESEYEIHFMGKEALRDLAKQPGFAQDKIRRVLESGDAPAITEQYRIQLAAIGGLSSSVTEYGWEVAEYTGPIETGDLIAAGVRVPDDALTSYQANVWILDGMVIKADLLLMDLPEQKIYKMTNWAKDDASIFGRGVPRQMRTSQAAANATFRMMMDNAGLAVGGQLVYSQGAVVPTDGNPRMTPRKTWALTDDARDVTDVFKIFEIPIHLEWLIPLFNLVMRLADEESQLPLIAQGDQAPHITKTKGGMGMLMDAAGVQLRRTIVGTDDGIVVPMASDFYAWNMLFNPDHEIKGDYNVVARGAAALFEREQQIQSFMMWVQFLNSNPMFTAVTKWDEVLEEGAALLRMNRSKMLEPPDKVRAIIEKMKNNPQQPVDPRLEVAKIVDKRERDLAQARNVLENAMHDKDVLVKIQAIATQAGLDWDKFLQDLGIRKSELDSENQRFNTETALRLRTGEGI